MTVLLTIVSELLCTAFNRFVSNRAENRIILFVKYQIRFVCLFEYELIDSCRSFYLIWSSFPLHSSVIRAIALLIFSLIYCSFHSSTLCKSFIHFLFPRLKAHRHSQ